MKNLFILIAAILITATCFAQAPEKMSYQAVVRDASGALVVSSPVGMRISILLGSTAGGAVYVETHTPTTNANGLVSIEVGGGTVSSGNFSTIDWGNGLYFLKTETDPTGGINYTISGTSQLLSVPYALHASVADSIAGGIGRTYVILSGSVTDAQAVSIIQRDAGPNTQFVWIENTTQLTSVDFSGLGLSDAVEIRIQNNQMLSSVVFPDLVNVFSSFTCEDNPVLTSLSTPVLAFAEKIYFFENSALISIGFPALAIAGSIECLTHRSVAAMDFSALTSVGTLDLSRIELITSLSFPALTTANVSIDIAINDLLATVNFPVLAFSEVFSISLNGALTSVSVPSLTDTPTRFRCSDNSILGSISAPALASVGDVWCSGNFGLTSLSFPALTSAGGLPPPVTKTFNCSRNAFNSPAVNTLLAQLVATSPLITGYTIDLRRDISSPPAPPTGQGITDKATLIANGNTVTTD